jgi:hypothetical protein
MLKTLLNYNKHKKSMGFFYSFNFYPLVLIIFDQEN